MKIEVDVERLTALLDNWFGSCRGCLAENTECPAHKGVCATKSCNQSIIEWLMKKENK